MTQTSQIIDISFRHALIGTWYHPEEYAEYTVTALGETCKVSGTDTSDREFFIISDVSRDGRELRFTSLMPSTQYELRHMFRIASESEVEHEWVGTERWRKKPPNKGRV